MTRPDAEALTWLVVAAFGLVAAFWLAQRTWTRFVRRTHGANSAALGRGGPPSTLDRLFVPLEAAHPGQSGLMTLLDGADAFAARAMTAGLAGRSLDLMYYLWRTDLAGWLLIETLLAAADRGVRIRLLLDDVNVQGLDRTFLALSQHPMIEVRLFNPTRHRRFALRRAIEMVLGLSHFNRRMHGKLWIVDGRLVILGGRNIGDTYFGAREGEPVSVDADVMLVGDKVAGVETVFDSYWNLGLSMPIRALWPGFTVSAAAFRRRLARKTHGTAARRFQDQTLADRTPDQVLTARLRWTDKVTLLADPPDKAYGAPSDPGMAGAVHDLLDAARAEVLMITPYFVPGNEGMAHLTGLCARGVKVSLLTNALAVADKVVVHGAYRHYRTRLLAAGGILHEFAGGRGAGGPDLGASPLGLGSAEGAGTRGDGAQQGEVLHSKIFVIDQSQAVVGSLNFDLRSALTNTELGLLFEEPSLVAELVAHVDRLCAPSRAFAVTEVAGRLHWAVSRPGQPADMTVEPEASAVRRALSWIVGQLPIQHYL